MGDPTQYAARPHTGGSLGAPPQPEDAAQVAAATIREGDPEILRYKTCEQFQLS